MKKRPSSACPSRVTPSTSRPLSAQPIRRSVTKSQAGGREDALHRVHFQQRSPASSPVHNAFVTSSHQANLSASQHHKGADGKDENSIPQLEDKSASLLRGLVSAESGLKKTSLMELLIQAFLRTKSDVKVLRDFSNYCLTTPQHIDASVMNFSAQDVFATNVNDSTRIAVLLKLHDLRDQLIFGICSRLLIEKSLGMNYKLEPIPDSCSPHLESLLKFVDTFMGIEKELTSKNSQSDPFQEKNIHSLQEKVKTLEQSYSTLQNESRILKNKYTKILTDGGKHQGMARQQHAIDELELRVKAQLKKIEDAENAKKMALKSEMKLKDDILQLEAQLATLRNTYEGELGSLKPMVYEQVSYTHDNLKEIRDLKTNIILAKERYTALLKQHEATKQELRSTKQTNSELNRELGLMTDKADTFQNESVRLEKILNVTTAAKLSSDRIKTETEDAYKKLTSEYKAVQSNLERERDEREILSKKLKVSEGTLLEAKRQEEQFKLKYQAKCCEVVSAESALDDQAVHIKNLMRRLSQSNGDMAIDFSMKTDKNKMKGRIHPSLIPQISLADSEDGTSSGKKSKFIEMLEADEESRHEEEIRKKDNKIKKLEDKLRKSQSQLKDALNRVWGLEKAKLDEAAGAIPTRR